MDTKAAAPEDRRVGINLAWPLQMVLARDLFTRRLSASLSPLVALGLLAISSALVLQDVNAKTSARDTALLQGLLIAAVCQFCLIYPAATCLWTRRLRVAEKAILVLGGTVLVLATLRMPGFLFVRAGEDSFGRVFIQAVTLVVAWRLVFQWLVIRISPFERLLLIGSGPRAVRLAQELLERRDELCVDIVGFIEPDAAGERVRVLNVNVVGAVPEIPDIVREHAIDRVAVGVDEARGRLPMDRLLTMRMGGVQFEPLASVYEEYTGKIAIEGLHPSALVFSSGFEATRWVDLKRVIDVMAASLAALFLLPVIALVALVVKVTSRGPVLYRQQRVGHQGRVFTIYKFRSMRADAEAATGAVWAERNDPRVTAVGRVLRRWRLDELPQFWNVLLGDMSLVGPRPERPEFVRELERKLPYYGQRHVVRPGLTGWAQVRFTYARTTDAALRKLQYDLYYVKNMSLALDMFIIARTFATVLFRDGD